VFAGTWNADIFAGGVPVFANGGFRRGLKVNGIRRVFECVSFPDTYAPFVLSEVEGRAASDVLEARTSTSLSANGLGKRI
jgi:hypothetical protein